MTKDSSSASYSSAPAPDSGIFRTSFAPENHTVARATHRVLPLRTTMRLELVNLTEPVQEAVRTAQVREGLVLVSSLHTTLALMVNEWQEALLQDIRTMLGDVIPAGNEYRHNDPRYSDCDRRNAHSHLQATLLGHSLSFGVTGGRLALGQFQAIIAAELDGPRERTVTAQIFSFA